MPELPEVETIKRGLSTLIIGRVVKKVRHDTPRSFPNSAADIKQFLIGSEIRAVRRRAKVLLIDLSAEYTLMIHLKMTGQLVFIGLPPHHSRTASRRAPNRVPTSVGARAADVRADEEAIIDSETRFGAGHPTDSLIGELPDKSTRVTLEFSDGSKLFFNDQRKFGWVKLLPTAAIESVPFMQKVGPEPLGDDFTPAMFSQRFKRRARTNIKAALLDQTVIAGVGNIYADESLWGAQIHPATLVGTLGKKELQKLFEEVRYVLNLSIEKGGSTDRNYVNAEGKKGSYIDCARVFRREGLPCPRCKSAIIKTRVAGRGTHLCSICQKVS